MIWCAIAWAVLCDRFAQNCSQLEAAMVNSALATIDTRRSCANDSGFLGGERRHCGNANVASFLLPFFRQRESLCALVYVQSFIEQLPPYCSLFQM